MRNAPIPNVIKAAERSGIIVFGTSLLSEKFDAVSVWPDSSPKRPVICYRKGVDGDRLRLSIAHEIGHLVLHQTRDIEPKQAETEAFRFGASLLIPKSQALEAIDSAATLYDFALIKATWGVSIAALIRRAFDLRIIDQIRYRSLMKQLSARGWRKKEPVGIAVEHPTLLPKAIRLAYGSDRPAAIATKTGLAPIAIRDLVA